MFDIHVYGGELLAKLEELGADGRPVLFHRAVNGQLPFEICRYFLAGLQLVRKLSTLLYIGCPVWAACCDVPGFIC